MKPIIAAATLASAIFVMPTAHAISCSVGGGGSSSDNFGVDRKVFGAGGGTSGSDNFSIEATIGQPTENTEMSSPGFSSGSGLWNTLGTGEGDGPVFDPVGCAGDFPVYTLADYDAYVAADFGRNGGTDYQHLVISASISAAEIAMVSPCRIRLDSGISINADTLVLDGRQEIDGAGGITINANEACLTSNKGKVKVGSNFVVLADELEFNAKKVAEIGEDADIQVSGTVTLDSSNGKATIRKNATITVGNIFLNAAKNASIGDNALVQASSQVAIQSTTKNHSARLEMNSTVSSVEMTVSAMGTAAISSGSQVTTTGDLSVTSLGADDPGGMSKATVERDAALVVGSNMTLSSQGKSRIDQDTVVIVSGEITMDAASASASRCKVAGSASITYGNKSGVCVDFLP